MNLICWVLPLAFVSIEGRLQHNRPKNGIGSFLLSHDDDHEHYNMNTVMATFDLECLNGNEEIQDAKVESIINHFDGCLKKHDTTKQHFQCDKQGISFLQFSNSDRINCVNNHKNNGKFDYNLHCVDMFSYEPIFSLQNFGGVGENYTIFTNSSQYECVTQATDAASLPGGWAWGLDRTDSKTSDNLFTYPIVNGDNENGVDLYVVDTGIRSTHDEFYPGQVVHELGDGYARYDPFGYVASHGTHVAGTAGGKNFGVSKNLTIYDYRVCIYSEYSVPSSSSDTPCYWNLILTGLDMIRDRLRNNNRRGVINLSLGGSRAYFSELYDWYFTQIVKYGGIVTLPAGNSYADACDYSPAFSSSALTVGAVSSTLEMAYFSNWGNCVDVWAPGMDIYSGIASGDSDYAAYQGTSMAAPHICGFVANLLLINPGLTFNDIKYLLIESKNDVNASNQITTDECDPNYNGYECIFPLFDCNTLPNNYVGYDYISSTDAPIYDPILQTSETSYDVYNGHDFINYECNTIAVAIIDDDAGTTNISVSEVVYEATDVCATRKTDNSLYTSWAYVCVDNDIAAFVAWEGETCDSNLYELSISKIIYDGMIDQGYWYHVNCDNEHPNYDNITDYKASVGDDNDCEVRVRLFFATDWIDLSDNIQQHLFNDSDSDKYNGIGSLIPSLLENATYSGNYQCSGFNASDETYWDVVYAIGTCNWFNGGSSSYIITCNETLNTITYSYYSGSDCSGSVTSTSTTYGGCYEDDGYYVDVIYCGTLPEYETPDDLGSRSNQTYNISAQDSVVFVVGDNGSDSQVELYECGLRGCSVNKTWYIIGQCENPTLSVAIVETDFASTSEYATIYMDENSLGRCTDLDEDCTYDIVNCSDFDQRDISGYVNESASFQTVEIGMSISYDVNICQTNSSNLLEAIAVVSCSSDDDASSGYQCDNIPNGVSYNVSISNLSEWTLCYNQSYSHATSSLDLTSCGNVSNPNLVWFVGAKETILSNQFYMGAFVTPSSLLAEDNDNLYWIRNANATYYEYGSWWYYAPSYAIGFSGDNQSIYLNSCDFIGLEDNYRLCWHLSGSGGYRAGSNYGLNSNTIWQKEIYYLNCSDCTHEEVVDGVQYNYSVSNLENNGWTLCYFEPYSDGTSPTDFTLCGNTSNPNVVLFVGALTSDSSSEFYMGAFVTANRLLAQDNDNLYQTRNADATLYDYGSWWYYAPTYSVGFSGHNQSIYLYSCDFIGHDDNYRLCWHFVGSGGYRAGTNLGLNSDSTWHKAIYYKLLDSDCTTGDGTPEPSTTPMPTPMPTQEPTETVIDCDSIPNGVQYNIPIEDLNEWNICYDEPYSDITENIDFEFCANVSDKNITLFVGAKETDSSTTFYMGAFVTANGLLGENNDNLYGNRTAVATYYEYGSWWYYAPSYSVGFSGHNQSIYLNACDFIGHGDNYRLCWHLNGNSGGYRAGSNVALNGDSVWQKVVYYLEC